MNHMNVPSSAGAPSRPHVRWNLTALMLDVTFYSLGMAFIDPTAIMPLLLNHLGASGSLIGAFASLKSLGFNGFQLVVAYLIHGKARQKPTLSAVATITRLPLLLMPVIMYHASDSASAKTVALYGMIGILVLWSLGDGLGYVPWMEIVARAFEPKTRGRFFATSQIVSGVSSVAIGLLAVRAILQNPHIPYPHSYALLAGIAAAMFMVSLIGVLIIKEPPAVGPPQPAIPARDYFVAIPRLLHNRVFARLALVQLLLGFGATAAPFYVLYAVQHFHVNDFWGGAYQGLQALGIVLLMPFWTLITERINPAAAIRAVGITILLTPLTALGVGSLGPAWFGLVFMLMGGSLGWGLWIVVNHYLLAHVSMAQRPAHIATLSLLFVPSALFPFIGGLFMRGTTMITVGQYPLLFVLTAAITAVGLLLSFKLPNVDLTEN